MGFHQALVVGTNAVGDVFQFGFWMDTGVSGSTAQDTADAVAASFNQMWGQSVPAGTAFKDWFTAGNRFEKITVYDRPDLPGPALDVAETPLVGRVGEGTGNALPSECAICISLHTGRPGRSYRGRMYLPAPVASACQADGRLSVTNFSRFGDWAASFFGDVNDGVTRRVGVFSRQKGEITPVTFVSVGDQVDVQKRRQNTARETYYSANVSGV